MEGSRVCLAPLRFGAGIKGKLIDAMQCGTPSVYNRYWSRGMADGFRNGQVLFKMMLRHSLNQQ